MFASPVDPANLADPTALADLAALLEAGRVVVLSGAGLSTESGIPDYRGPSGAATRKHAPMTYQAFTRDPDARRRYWARSHVGWRIMTKAEPNAGHRAVADLERSGRITGVITQNVDGLHTAAGSTNVIDLHGRLNRVRCLSCNAVTGRAALDERLRAANRDWSATVTVVNPDGDVELPNESLEQFTTVDCATCGGILKPDVVYFGENVPADRVAEAYGMVDDAQALLVLGSSLTVFSGRRFVLRAAQRGMRIAIVNQGPTRGDDHATIRIDAPLGTTLAQLAAQSVSA